MFFYYDENGTPVSVALKRTKADGVSTENLRYYYVKNLQGDIVGMADESGVLCVNYTYDAWGNLTSKTDGSGNTLTDKSNIGLLNPLRYRGYVYDTDTGLYYLQSRYYDPVTGRFINPDSVFADINTFRYCKNNAICMNDKGGTDAIWLQDIDGVGGAGHTGLLVQNRNGTWGYFYWGSNECKFLRLPNFPGYTTLQRLNNYLCETQLYYGWFEGCIYLNGDYDNSYKYAQTLHKFDVGNWFGGGYNVFTNNCVQVCIDVLLKSISSNENLYFYLSIARSQIIPNTIYNTLVATCFKQYQISYNFNKFEINFLSQTFLSWLLAQEILFTNSIFSL